MSDTQLFLTPPRSRRGRAVIPAGVRQHHDIEPGDNLILSGDDQGIHLQTFAQAVRAAQAAFASFRIPGVSFVDEPIRERQEEARREIRD